MNYRLMGYLMIALFSLSSATVVAGTFYSRTLYQQSYTASQTRQFEVYVPTGATSSAPMVMALHGCKQTNTDVKNDWGLVDAADQYGFVLVMPFITSYDGLRNENCWGFWFENHRHEGSGEAEDLHQIGLLVEQEFSIDPNRRYITGLSSGGAMAEVAAITHNEYWAASASVAGLPYGEDAASVSLSGQCPGNATFHSVGRVANDINQELDDDYPIPMMVIQSENDCTVVQPAGRNIRDSHLLVFGSENFNSPSETRAKIENCSPVNGSNDYGCEHEFFTQDGNVGSRSIVETVFYNGPLSTPNTQDTNHGHYWIGGQNGNNGKWSIKLGPSMPDIIWDFFNRHPKQAGTSVNKPIITMNGANPMLIALGNSFNDPGATAYDAEDGSLVVQSSCNVNTAIVGDYYCSYSATDSDNYTGTATRTIEVYDPNAPTETCAVSNSSPSDHIQAGRANAGGSYNLRAISTGDQNDIGFAWDSWSTVTLTEGEPGLWYLIEPAACHSTPPPPSSFECQQWYGSNLQHSNNSRAYYSMGYYTVGGNDYLGGVSGSYSWVAETSDGIFEVGQCP
ncbi:PHB depolymerase family esterase [Reinekea marina]|uniref:PHB depolymerase family esterase n=1 Tax=Reinekea marina TaxID=1310421 RepID=A0ABV7WMH6_9GAMM|nr:PHB depolymerase family esterase [Reinekea marina]MDN3649472.1 PHB depolymerase family esterase [Reinekea marina]